MTDFCTFGASSVAGLQKAINKAIEDYLETCKELKKEPNNYFKGVFNVPTSNELHRDLALITEKNR